MDYSNMFVYDNTSPSGLRWKYDRLGGKTWKTVVAEAGSIAGNLNKASRNWTVSFVPAPHNKRTRVMAHHIVLSLHGVQVPEGFVVDHINGDYSDNRLANLRVVSQSVNMRNAARRSDNATGVTGVTAVHRKQGNKYYVAQWLEGERHKSKTFSVIRYGEQAAFNMAVEARLQAIVDLNTDGYGYSERHGK